MIVVNYIRHCLYEPFRDDFLCDEQNHSEIRIRKKRKVDDNLIIVKAQFTTFLNKKKKTSF